MKKRIGTKVLSLFLALMMIVPVIPMGTITASAAETWVFPVAGKTTSDISSYWGSRWGKHHPGLDIPGYECTVVSAFAGTVIAIYNNCPHYNTSTAGCTTAHNNTYGNLIKIQHPDGRVALYGHLKQNTMKVYVGQYVEAGQPLAITGSSGMSTGSHLHFEVRKDKNAPYDAGGININPGNITYVYSKGEILPAKSYKVGTYECTSNIGVNMRSGAGTNYGKVTAGFVTYGTRIYVTSTNGNWGLCTNNGQTGWVCLDYFNIVSEPAASIPTLSADATVIAQGKSVTLNYNSSNATKYYVYRSDISTPIYEGASTTFVYNLPNAGTYNFFVVAENRAGAKTAASSTVSVIAKPPCKVDFVDYDGTILSSVNVRYNEGAVAPKVNPREGYDFYGWDVPYNKVTGNLTVKALYTKKQYTVNFYGQYNESTGEYELLKSQKVLYGENAIPPIVTNAAVGYEFTGWNCEDYKNVYVKDGSTVNVYAVYSWINGELPIYVSNVSASRDKDADGYNVSYTITNYNKATTKGRAIITLKTAEGKLVSTTESASFKIGKNATRTFTEFVDTDKAATVVEVIIVNGISTGVPLSRNVSSTVNSENMWSDWSDVRPTGDGLELDTRVVYHSRTKSTATNSTNYLAGGYIWDGTRSESVYYTDWLDYRMQEKADDGMSSYSTVLNNTRTQNVYATRVLTCYYHFYKRSGGNHTYCPTNHAGGVWHQINVPSSSMTWYGTSSDNSSTGKYYGPACYECGATHYWFMSVNRTDDMTETYVADTKTQYQYKTVNYTYNFYKWNDWSDWSTTPVSASNNVQVEQKTQYRYYSSALNLEDTTGETRTVSGTLSTDLAGKQLTLFIYKYADASDYTDEFVGQTTVGNDGSYSFTFKLREEPSAKTGDFTIALGIEGTTALQVIGKIDAPKPVYSVVFRDYNGNIISTQNVTEGDSAVLPETPVKDGFKFVYWDQPTSNVKSDLDIKPVFEQEEYTIIFVDWKQQTLEMQKVKEGEVLSVPEVDPIEGYIFLGWDKVSDNAITATSDMVITAQYEAETHTIKFVDVDGETVISEQEVAYGESAYIPDYNSDAIVYGFANPQEYQNVIADAVIYPEYCFSETTPTPTANYETGEYRNNLQLTLTCEDNAADIYYSLNGSEMEEKYTGPITIDTTCSVTFHAESLGKNNSEPVTNYYCINTSNQPSEWMLNEDIPEYIKADNNQYSIQESIGFRFKDVQKTTSTATAQQLAANGWTLESKTSALASDEGWQDTVISSANTSLLDCKVETRVVPDTTVKKYTYSHYVYTNSSNVVCYSPTEVAGYDCTYETITLNSRLATEGFLDDDMTAYYLYNNQQWFSQRQINGEKTQYRLNYNTATYFKWTPWGVIEPAANETRIHETATVYRYANNDFHIINIIDGDIIKDVMFVKDGETVDTTDLANEYGYNFNGLFTDAELTTPFNPATNVTMSYDLYASYTPKQYTVTFKMQDGTELDVQTVNYLDPAEEPDTDSVRGWVFAGWDKDFSSIKEDTVVTGKYVKDTKYALVKVSVPKLMMYVGNFAKLSSSVTDATASRNPMPDEEVVWASSDYNVVSVDKNGNVQAVGAGTAQIIATATSSGETAVCEVTVNADVSTSVILKNDSAIGLDGERNIRVTPSNDRTVAAIKSQFVNDDLKVYNKDGVLLADDALVTTKSRVVLEYNDAAVDSLTVVFTGDFNCDGYVDNKDVVMINQYVLEKRTADRYQMIAIDVNGDGSVNNRDCSMLSRYIVGKVNF